MTFSQCVVNKQHCPPSGIRSQISFSTTYMGRAATKKCVSCPEPRQGSCSHDWLTLCPWEKGLSGTGNRLGTSHHYLTFSSSASLCCRRLHFPALLASMTLVSLLFFFNPDLHHFPPAILCFSCYLCYRLCGAYCWYGGSKTAPIFHTYVGPEMSGTSLNLDFDCNNTINHLLSLK